MPGAGELFIIDSFNAATTATPEARGGLTAAAANLRCDGEAAGKGEAITRINGAQQL
jgi:hypothetical protein